METNWLEPAPWSRTEEDRRVRELIAVIRQTWAALSVDSAGRGIPSSVRSAVELLRHHVRQPYSAEQVEQVLTHRDVSRLHKGLLAKLAEAEAGMELADALQLGVRSRLELDDLGDHGSWRVYETLVGHELELLGGLLPAGLPLAFVGSGPLPLSAVLIHLRQGSPVTCIDSDPAACAVSRTLLGRLGLKEGIRVVQEEGCAFDYAPYAAVFVASLVSGKAGVLERIRDTRADAVVAVRTAEGMRRLMYESVDEAGLSAAGWSLLGRTRPAERVVINSTLLYRQS
ncbi:hypothetical protein J2T17_005195 [Paenibacillus mucilaginosus]|uniref:nicotianamine synthase family protein n=1 Tax=Paenibacillus mucilaginosus TaxID=61624 RepID=UPI003D204848